MNEQALRALTKRALDDTPFPNPNFPPSPYYRFLKHLAAELKPSLSVELGVCGGGGSLHLCLGHPGGVVVGIDLEEDHHENTNYIGLRCPNFEFWQGDSIELAGAVYERHGSVGILFIDTIHTYERTWKEYNTWLPYLASEAVVCFDDLLRAEMGNFWEELHEPKLRLDELHATAEGGFGAKWFER